MIAASYDTFSLFLIVLSDSNKYSLSFLPTFLNIIVGGCYFYFAVNYKDFETTFLYIGQTYLKANYYLFLLLLKS